MSRILWQQKEKELENRLHKIYEEIWETEDKIILRKLKKEREEIDLALGEIRLALYVDNRNNDNG
jgi:hypothetical protein